MRFIFIQFNALQIFNAINTGAELGLATPLTTAASVSFFLTIIVYLDPEHIYKHTKVIKNMQLNKYKKYPVLMLYVHTFEDWMWNYCKIK